ncbi:MAG: hypothetical protein AAGD34_15485 [Pseudomonadota bacterium]
MRRLRDDATFEAFVDAWQAEPDHFGQKVTVTHARNIEDPREIVSYAMIDTDRATLDAVLQRTAQGEAARHERIAPLIASTVVKGIYEIASTHDLT